MITGAIDIHIHGIGGYDTTTSNPDDILKIAGIEGGLGAWMIVPTIYSGPVSVMRENMAAVKAAMEIQDKAIEDRNVSPAGRGRLVPESSIGNHGAALIAGVHLEGPFLNPSCCGALDPATFLKPDEKILEELFEGFEGMVKLMTIAPELDGTLNIIGRLRDKGVNPSMGHSHATYSEAEAGHNAGALGITHLFNAMRGIHHREPGLAGFGLLHKDVYIEVIADPHHLHPRILDMIFQIKNPRRIIVVSDSTKGTPDQTISDYDEWKTGAPAREGVILQGGATAIVDSARHLTRMGIPEDVVLMSVRANPATYLRQSGSTISERS